MTRIAYRVIRVADNKGITDDFKWVIFPCGRLFYHTFSSKGFKKAGDEYQVIIKEAK